MCFTVIQAIIIISDNINKQFSVQPLTPNLYSSTRQIVLTPRCQQKLCLLKKWRSCGLRAVQAWGAGYSWAFWARPCLRRSRLFCKQASQASFKIVGDSILYNSVSFGNQTCNLMVLGLQLLNLEVFTYRFLKTLKIRL